MVIKINFISERYWPYIGGAELFARELVFGLKDEFDIRVVCESRADRERNVSGILSSDNGIPFEKDRGVEIAELCAPKFKSFFLLSLYTLVGRIPGLGKLYSHLLGQVEANALELTWGNPDLIYAVYAGSEERFFYQAYQKAARKGIPFVFQPLCHQNIHWEQSLLVKLYRKSDAVVALTETERNWLIEHGAPAEKTHVIPAAPLVTQSDPSATSLREELNIDGPIVLFLGRKVAYKGYHLILEAAKTLHKDYPGIGFVFIGPDTEESFEQLKEAESFGVFNLGEVEATVKTRALQACDILCIPSSAESFGLSFLEAWVFAKPVIAARTPAIEELLRNGGGILVEQTLAEVSSALKTLLDDEEERKRVGQLGLEQCKLYSWNNTWSSTKSLINSLLDK